MSEAHQCAPTDSAVLLRAVSPGVQRSLRRALPVTVLSLLAGACLVRLQIDFGALFSGISKLGWLAGLMWPPSAQEHLPAFLGALAETLGMAFLGVLLASLVALPMAALAARSVSPTPLLRSLTRRFLDLLRGIDVLIWAMVFVSAVGLGPFAGVLAIAIGETGVLGKLFADALDDVDRGVRNSVRATGAGRLGILRFASFPQAFPVMANQALYYFESNVRSATILGIVGAGGIGFQLADRIRMNEWQQVAALIVLILFAVIVIDRISVAISHRYLATNQTPAAGGKVALAAGHSESSLFPEPGTSRGDSMKLH
jgi:phosphonate transport system permease protein